MNQAARLGSVSTWVLVVSCVLFSDAIQAAHAQLVPPLGCSTTTIDMKLLVVTNGKTEADFPAIKQILDYLGTPYDVLDMTLNSAGVTASMLSDGSCHGYYQGVIFAYGAYIHTLPGMSTLTDYEQAFGIRRAAAPQHRPRTLSPNPKMNAHWPVNRPSDGFLCLPE